MDNPLLTDFLTAADGLATKLSAARRQAGLTGRDLARVIGWPESKVSRIGKGRQMPAADEVREWGRAVGLDPVEIAELVELASSSEATALSWNARLAVGRGSTQRSYAALHRDTTQFHLAHPALIPGLLQTEAYARWVIAELALTHGAAVDVHTSVAERLARRRHLNDETKRFHILITEQLLTGAAPGHAIMAEQLDHLLTQIALDRPNVSIGVLPNNPDTPTLLAGFEIYDQTLVIVEDQVSEHSYFGTDDDRVLAYIGLWDRLATSAIHGDDAAHQIRAAADQIDRNLSPGSSKWAASNGRG